MSMRGVTGVIRKGVKGERHRDGHSFSGRWEGGKLENFTSHAEARVTGVEIYPNKKVSALQQEIRNVREEGYEDW